MAWQPFLAQRALAPSRRPHQDHHLQPHPVPGKGLGRSGRISDEGGRVETQHRQGPAGVFFPPPPPAARNVGERRGRSSPARKIKQFTCQLPSGWGGGCSPLDPTEQAAVSFETGRQKTHKENILCLVACFVTCARASGLFLPSCYVRHAHEVTQSCGNRKKTKLGRTNAC